MALAAVLAGTAAMPAAALEPPARMVRGANVSGGEFGKVPGVFGTDYTYPTEEEIDYYAERGFTVLRVPFCWERLQPELYGDLHSKSDGTGDFDRLKQVIRWITGRGMIAMLDPHNYGERIMDDGVARKIGSDTVPTPAFEDFWVRLANAFKDDDLVWFNLMNEPQGIAAEDWKAVAQSVTDAIRATGAHNRLVVPGTAWTGAHSWVSSGNAAAMAGFNDPIGNFAFDVHQYLDSDSSGTSGTCVPGSGSARFEPFIAWAKEAPGRRGFLGEFAAGDPTVPGQAQCAVELKSLLDTAEGSGVFDGWAAWGGGLWWTPDYIFRLEPPGLSGPDTNYMNALKAYVGRDR